jgi:hypothetical protein
MQPTLFETNVLPFDARVDAEPGPVESDAREKQPSLLGPHPGQDTDCANVLLEGQWLHAEALLERLRDTAPESQIPAIDEALPFVRELALRPAMTHVARIERLVHAARFSSTNCWVRHASLFLVRRALASMGSERLAQALDERALPFVYSLLRAQQGMDNGAADARAVLRDALAAGKKVDLLRIDDRDVLVLDGESLSPAWYPVLGAMMGLWDVPKARPTRKEIDRALADPIPSDDEDRAHMFWQCYRAWRAQRDPNDVVQSSRRRMKQLNPSLFATRLEHR